jgi:DNA-binding NarL/FixJ family response regulator
MNKIRVLLVDDHRLMLQGLMAMLVGSGNIEIVGTASTGEEAVNLASQLNPDIVLMDIMLKNMTGIEACRWIKERHGHIKVILLSMEVKKEYLTAGIQSGISGYLAKDIDQETLLQAIQEVFNGKQYFTEALTKLVFEDFYAHEKVKSTSRTKLNNDLTKRESEVLALVASGKSNKEIADALFISVKTVETHKSHTLEKLGLKNSAELIKYAIKNNIISV